MNRHAVVRLILIVIFSALLASCSGLLVPANEVSEPPTLVGMETNADADYLRVTDAGEIIFPRDHGPHPDYLTEWWYYTGNLETGSGRHFGYQLTFFRRALLPAAVRVDRSSDWAADQVYMAHFALTDTQRGRFYPFERFARGSAGLAGAQAEPHYRVWLEDWSVEQVGDDEVQLIASADGISIDLRLIDLKGPILQGENGFSLKGAEDGNASIYISQTRMAAEGKLTISGTDYDVRGLSWMDHEFSTSALGPGLVGWDWFSIQLDDESELMLFTLRRDDGSIDSFSSGTLIAADGSTRPFSREDFSVIVTDTWRSPQSGAEYPSGWRIEIPFEDLTLEVRPRLADQELNLSFVYWEGAVQVTGWRAGNTVNGSGYVELTGYAQSMQGQF